MSRVQKGKERDQVTFHVKTCKKSTNWGDAHDGFLELGKDALKFLHLSPSPRSGSLSWDP